MEVAPGVHQVSAGGSHAFVVDGDEGVTLVDTGMPRRHGKIVDLISSLGRSVDDISAIVVTHAHADHVGGGAELKRLSGAAVYVSAIDSPAARGDEPKPSPPALNRLPFLKPVLRMLPDAEPLEVDHEVTDGARLPGDLTVVATPGHTPGHVSYLLDREGGVMFVGDAAVATSKGAIRRGWMNMPTPEIDAGIRTLAAQTFSIACFGHSVPVLGGASVAFAAFATDL